MRNTVEEQIRIHYRGVDAIQDGVEWEDIVGRLQSETLVDASPATSGPAWRRVGLALVSGLALAAVVAIPALLTEFPDGAADPPPSSTLPAGEVTPSILTAPPGPAARIGEDNAPFGDLVIEQAADRFDFTPVGSHWTPGMGGFDLGSGSITVVDGGYAAVGGHIASEDRIIIISTDGLTWQPLATSGLEDLTGTATMFPAFEAYWIQQWFAEGGVLSFRLYRSEDLRSWEEIDLPVREDDPGRYSSTWVPFSDRLVAFGEGGIVVDPVSLVATDLETPWGSDQHATSVYATATGLRVTVSTEGPGGDGDSNVEEYETADLVTWSGPSLPSPLQADVRVWELPTGAIPSVRDVVVRGGPDDGYVASIRYDAVDFRGEMFEVSYFSADGEDWSISADPNGLPESPTSEQIVSTRIDGRLALVSQVEHLGRPGSVLVSDDGIEWQAVPLDPIPSPGIDPLPDAGVQKSMDVVGDKVFYYDNVQGWLNSWVIEIPGS